MKGVARSTGSIVWLPVFLVRREATYQSSAKCLVSRVWGATQQKTAVSINDAGVRDERDHVGNRRAQFWVSPHRLDRGRDGRIGRHSGGRVLPQADEKDRQHHCANETARNLLRDAIYDELECLREERSPLESLPRGF
jgi:hypothetical protein